MIGFLEQMATASHERVKVAARREPLEQLRSRVRDLPAPPGLNISQSFELIAEYKLRSPARGRLAGDDDQLASRVIAYAQGGAIAVSVLTEPARFGGRLGHLTDAAATLAPLGVPVLRKDFLIDPYQLHETRAVGAGGALLIIRILSDSQLREMLECARELELFVLLEAFDAEDIRRAMAEVAARVPERSIRISRSDGTPPPDPRRGAPLLLGINCRNLQTLEVAPRRFGELASLLPDDLPRVAESGIETPDDCAGIVRAGYNLALVGGALMTAKDPAAVIGTMLAAGRAASRVAA